MMLGPTACFSVWVLPRSLTVPCIQQDLNNSLSNHRKPSLICPAGSLWELAEALVWNGYANYLPEEIMSLQRSAMLKKLPNCGRLQALQIEDPVNCMNVM